ncbi:MAG: TIGR03013 family PEP-CTERM/XrtA system glycosyltransferase [Gammaproteobacteria bacterium]|nr:TIGR03013 family PEP-CTERM/XrtA system glycosyltransferase [Gammaproteobacteria bacterium]
MIRLFKHYIPKSLVLLGLAEFLVFVSSVYFGFSFRFSSAAGEVEVESLGLRSLIFAVVMYSCMIAMGLYQRHLRDGRKGMFIRIGVSFAIGFVVMSLMFYLFPGLFLGRGIFGLAFAFAFVGVVASRLLYIKLVNREALNRRILVVGAGKKAHLMESLLKRRTDKRGFSIVGYVPIGDEKSQISENKLIHHSLPLNELVTKYDVDEVILAITDRRKSFPVEELLDCKMSGVLVTDILTFFERQVGRIVLELLQPSWLIFSDGFSHGVFRNISKRSFDIAASMILLAFTFPIMLFTMLCIYLEDRGPVFYRQVRVGQNWKLVQVMKFRSMRIDAEKAGAQFATANDDRVTRCGRFIRKTRIDELPQLFNVLKGEMSFVGPRPERPQFVEEFSENIPFYAERHRVKPGITGWAQICYPYGASEKDTIEKLQYDLYYVKNYSLFLDLTILFQTAEVILWGKGAR